MPNAGSTHILKNVSLILLVGLFGLNPWVAAAEPAGGSGESAAEPDNPGRLPYGHPDFYPSPERPLGWRGDGAGAWPGAKVVTFWNAETGENIVWKSPMPAPSFSQPLVVGEKVLTMADPNLLICVSVHDGKTLWQSFRGGLTRKAPRRRACTSTCLTAVACRCLPTGGRSTDWRTALCSKGCCIIRAHALPY